MGKISENAKHAIYIGTLCSVSYFAVYIARNILSAVTPVMVSGGFDEEFIGSISSLYFVFYAVGQLINGAIGDKIKAKYMVGLGLLLAGVTSMIFPLVATSRAGALVVYGMTGFFLSMIYGPMTKVVSENTEPIYTTRCSLGYTFASFLGSPAAGLLAVFMSWQGVFVTSSVILLLMSLVVFLFFFLFERRGIVSYNAYQPKQKGAGNISILFQHQIVRFSFVAILTGVVRTSVVFWLPTYISQYLSFSDQASASIFSVATLVIAMTSFITVFVYERFLGHDMNKTVLVMFSLSVVFFLLTYLVHLPVLNIVFIVLAIMASNGAACMLWSRYCPSLRDTGFVSSATGFLDFLSYMAAAAANLLFANAISTIGWGNLILVWAALVGCGVIVSLPYHKMRRPRAKERASCEDSTEQGKES